MNPLSVWTFYRRHKGRVALLLSLTILVTAGLYLVGALVWGVFVEPARLSYMALSRFSIVKPEPPAIERIEKILKVEQEQGYRDTAIPGGLARFAVNWSEQAQREVEDKSWVVEIAGEMQAYSQYTTRSERQSSLETLRTSLQAKQIGTGIEENSTDPAVITQIRMHPDVAKVIRATFIKIKLPGMMSSEDFEFELLGLMEEDVFYVLEKCGATLKRGHMPEPGLNGLLLSADVAKILNVDVGDHFDVISAEIYEGVTASLEATSFEVVGILESDVRLGIVSLEFLNAHESYSTFPARFLVISKENRKAAVDNYLQSEIQTHFTEVMTLEKLNERIANEALPGLLMLTPPILIVTAAFSLAVVVVNWIANGQRLPEFGVLYATGHSKQWLINRLTMETASMAMVGWVVGLIVSWLVLYLLKVTVFAPRGYDFNFIAWIPLIFALPIPLTLVGFTFISVRRTLSRLDPVAVVERGELSQEGEWKRSLTASDSLRTNSTSLPRPLTAVTFYKRHRWRAVLLISGMGVIMLAVVLIFFTLAVSADAQEPLLGYLSKVSIVRSLGVVQDLDSEIVAKVKAHPAVERIIPVAPRYHMLGVNIPPFTGGEASPFGVYAQDMAYLVDLYGLELSEGCLPRPNTNEMVIPEALAQNRDLKVGDVIGDPNQPVYPGAPALEAEFVISGIFARAAVPKDENWWGFISLEFLETYTPFPILEVLPLIVVPKNEQKDILDAWLENVLAGSHVAVLTYRQQVARVQEGARNQMLGMALLESVIAIIAATTLAVLNYVFVSQRQTEFSVLHALGHSRRQLVFRTVREAFFTTGIAWVFSALLCLVGLLTLYLGVFTPLGLRFNLFNLTPWLYTFPIPVVVLAVSACTMAWMLSRLDPIATIERRS